MKKINKIIVILGMHRSGTSVLSRSMRVFGASLGNHLMDPQPCNPKGFFEDLDIFELNEKLLSQIEQQWCSLSPIPEKTLIDLVNINQEEAFYLLKEKIKEGNAFSFKDPRTAILIPFWKVIFSKLRVTAKYISIVRDPISVALSLHERDTFPIEQGILLWTKYNLSILKNTRTNDNFYVFFDEFINNTSGVIEAISQSINLPIEKTELDFFLKDFLDVSLMHHRNSIQHIEVFEKMPAQIKELYKILLDFTRGECSSTYKTKLKGIERWYQEMQYSLQLLDKTTL